MNYLVSFKNKNKGFTLVELVVVIAIAMVITTAVVIQQGSMNDQLALKTQAYELAMMIRQAQIYSLGVREDVNGSGDKFNVGYGMHIDTNGPVADRTIFFADRNGTLQYNSSPDEAIETKIFTRGIKVNKVCAPNPSAPPPLLCNGSSAPKQIDIIFLRPDPKVKEFRFMDNSGAKLLLSPPAIIRLISPNDKTIDITVEANGQISIE